MSFNKHQRDFLKECYISQHTHLAELLELKDPDGKLNLSVKSAKIERAIWVYILNGNKRKAQKKIDEFTKFSQDFLEDLLENRKGTVCATVDVESKLPMGQDRSEIMADMEKDGQYKKMCDLLMGKKTDFEFWVNKM
tara:strand:- start:403 stop:813 length:411 start_codon:yes stop_codon:yes gene_type:complete